MKEKHCFKCQTVKLLTEFYVHPQMADGHLGKCKTCTKLDTKKHQELKSATDLAWVLKERERHRVKQEKRRACGVLIPVESVRLAKLLWAERHPEKRAAHIAVRNAIRGGTLIRCQCEKCGKKAQAHHDDYSKPLDVRWLCPKHHAEHHRAEREKEIVKEFNKKHQHASQLPVGGWN